jgi:ABC-type transporter Mla MlaB component
VGIFSLFGKKDRGQPSSSEKAVSRPKREAQGAPSPRTSAEKSVTRPPHSKRDAQVALATALKIDAIESEMSSEFVSTMPPRSSGNATPGKPVRPTAPDGRPPQVNKALPAASKPTAPPSDVAGNTLAPALPDMGTTTQFLLGGLSTLAEVKNPAPQVTPVVEEAAIMFANGQNALVEQLLLGAIVEDNLGDTMQNVWLMLLDLYQITGKQQQFESLSLDYASKFETSPPGWTAASPRTSHPASVTGATPAVSFSGKLDTSASKQIERVQKLAENYRTLRLEFARIDEVDAEGCGLLLAALRRLQKSGHNLVLVGAQELTEKIRAIIEVGRRDPTEDAWLLLLELLRLLNREREFEEACIDYCVTFEVSPPAFVAPENKVTTATEAAPAASSSNAFVMPAVVEGRIDNLIVDIAAYSDEHCPAIIDCSQMVRVDFSAAGRLLTGLAPFCGNGKSIEFHHVNHLVTALFDVVGLKDLIRVVPRKN